MINSDLPRLKAAVISTRKECLREKSIYARAAKGVPSKLPSFLPLTSRLTNCVANWLVNGGSQRFPHLKARTVSVSPSIE
jgi:hypothetical protein